MIRRAPMMLERALFKVSRPSIKAKLVTMAEVMPKLNLLRSCLGIATKLEHDSIRNKFLA